MNPIRTKRIYESPEPGEEVRFLVERLWPRGIRKVELEGVAWLKDVAPSTDLRRWFAHDPAKWDDFKLRYFAELDAERRAWQPIVAAARREPVTVLYSAHDTEHNNAVTLQEYLEHHASKE
jgi:uncharacterized protein YeaO (DUF488 family)